MSVHMDPSLCSLPPHTGAATAPHRCCGQGPVCAASARTERPACSGRCHVCIHLRFSHGLRMGFPQQSPKHRPHAGSLFRTRSQEPRTGREAAAGPRGGQGSPRLHLRSHPPGTDESSIALSHGSPGHPPITLWGFPPGPQAPSEIQTNGLGPVHGARLQPGSHSEGRGSLRYIAVAAARPGAGLCLDQA